MVSFSLTCGQQIAGNSEIKNTNINKYIFCMRMVPMAIWTRFIIPK
jgi:hypothetical protein